MNDVETLATQYTDGVLPGLDRTVPQRLHDNARQQPDRIALTFADYATERAGTPRRLTFAELDRRVTAVALHVGRVAAPGDRVAVLTPQTLDYVVGFLGALRAGVVAVPLFSPDLFGHGDRLAAVLADCRPNVALASRSNLALVTDAVPDAEVIVVDELGDDGVDDYLPPAVGGDDLAYLQYTSGSTRTPAGVLISHANLVANTIQAVDAYGVDARQAEVVSWLPLFHDMGLTLVAGGCASRGIPATFMDPIAFLMKPVRWLQCMSRDVETISMAPNFAYALCASRVSEEDRAALDLRRVKSLVNGAEPVDVGAVARFTDAFAAAGLRASVVRPSYGLAEATCYVSGHNDGAPARTTSFDRAALSRGSATPTDAADAIVLASCGRPTGQRVAIADPATGTRLDDGTVGEIWVHGANVAGGYWNNAELSDETFDQVLVDAADLPGTGWLRTGDLGVLLDGEVYVTGRIKDLVIIDGRNHYPQDIEATVEAASPVVGRHRSAAFALTPDGAGETAGVVAEVSRHAGDEWVEADVVAAIRTAVSRRHGIALGAVVLVAGDQVPRTSSGKVARAATRDRFLAGTLAPAKPGS